MFQCALGDGWECSLAGHGPALINTDKMHDYDYKSPLFGGSGLVAKEPLLQQLNTTRIIFHVASNNQYDFTILELLTYITFTCSLAIKLHLQSDSMYFNSL